METYSHDYEMISPKHPAEPIVSAAEHTESFNAYPGLRTEQTRSPLTRVRRVFGFAQLFFFALTFMNSYVFLAAFTDKGY